MDIVSSSVMLVFFESSFVFVLNTIIVYYLMIIYIMFVFLKRERTLFHHCTKRADGRNNTRPFGIKFTDRKTLLPSVTYRNIGAYSVCAYGDVKYIKTGLKI